MKKRQSPEEGEGRRTHREEKKRRREEDEVDMLKEGKKVFATPLTAFSECLLF